MLWHRPPTESAQVGALRPRVDSRVHAYMASHRCSSCPARHAKSCAYRISHFRSGWSTLSCEDAVGCARICLRTAEVRSACWSQPNADGLVVSHVGPLVEGKRRELDRRDVCPGDPTSQRRAPDPAVTSSTRGSRTLHTPARSCAAPAASRMDVDDSFVRAAVRRYRSANRAGQAVLSRVLAGHVAEQAQRVLVNQSSEELLCVAEQQGVCQNLLLRVQCGEARHELAADRY